MVGYLGTTAMEPVSTALYHRGSEQHRAPENGKRGQLYQPYRQGPENQLGALGPVLNMVVLWNSVYLDAIVKYLREQGYPVPDEDLARLSPLGWRHINVQGRYAFISSPQGEPSPLRGPIDPDDEP